MPFRPLALALTLSIAAAFPSAVAAQSGPVTADDPGCPNPASIPPVESYRYAIDDVRTLAFIAYAEALPAAGHAAILQRATRPLPDDVARAIDAAISDACATSSISFRLTRFVYDVASRWSSDDALDLQLAARYAIAALYLAEKAGAERRDAALAIFGTSTADLDAFAARALELPKAADGTNASADCERTSIGATSVAPKNPIYPQTAIDMRAQGTVQITVGLDSHGFVRFATLLKRDVPQNAGGDALVDASLDAAGSTTYVPEFVKCRPIAGAYVFRAEYRGRS